MNYRLLGKSGLRVSEICLGAMTFGTEWGEGADKEESRRIFDLFIERGGNFIDTANVYTKGTSESYLGEFMQGMRNDIVLATKYSLSAEGRHISDGGNSKKNLVQTVEASLKRLRTEFIDVMYLHAWDFTTPIEEVMRSLDDLIRSGKVLYAGISDTPAYIVARGNTIAELRGWPQFIALQVKYSLVSRDVEREHIPMARDLDMAVTAWSPLGGGALTGKYMRNEPGRLKPDSNNLKPRAVEITKEVIAIADEIGVKPAHIAVQWLLRQPGVVLPIIGARTFDQMKENLDALNFPLNDEIIARLNKASEIDLGFPYDFLRTESVARLLFSGKKEKLINHRT